MIAANWLTPEIMRTLAWSLLHFLWQGAAIAALAVAFMAVFRESETRYLVGIAALLMVLASFGATFALLLNFDSHQPAVAPVHAAPVTSLRRRCKQPLPPQPASSRAKLLLSLR